MRTFTYATITWYRSSSGRRLAGWLTNRRKHLLIPLQPSPFIHHEDTSTAHRLGLPLRLLPFISSVVHVVVSCHSIASLLAPLRCVAKKGAKIATLFGGMTHNKSEEPRRGRGSSSGGTVKLKNRVRRRGEEEDSRRPTNNGRLVAKIAGRAKSNELFFILEFA